MKVNVETMKKMKKWNEETARDQISIFNFNFYFIYPVHLVNLSADYIVQYSYW